MELVSEEIGEIQRLIKRYLWYICARWQAQDVEDLTQRSLLRVIEVLQREPSCNGLPHSYIRKVAFSQMIDEYRKHRRFEPIERLEDETISSGLSPEKATMQREVGAAILKCLQKLSEKRKRAAFLMLAGHKNREIEALTGWDSKQVENYVSRGRADLKKCLTSMGIQP